MKFECPINYFKDNLVFGSDKSCWAVYEATGYDYDLLSDEMKISRLKRLTRFLSQIKSEAKIITIPINQNATERFRGLRERLEQNDPVYEHAMNQSVATERYLEQLAKNTGSINDYKTFVIVKLADDNENDVVKSLKEAYDYFVKSPKNAVEVYMNISTKDILKTRLEAFEESARKFEADQNKRLGLQATSTERTQWLIRRMAYRGLEKDVKLFYKGVNAPWTPEAETFALEKESIVRPYHRDVINLFSGVLKLKDRYIAIEHSDKSVSYQTFLTITNIPEILDFPGCEWIYMLQQHNTQAEICIHIKNIEYRESLKLLDFKKREINSQIEHISGSGSDIPDDLAESKDYADLMESELKQSRFPTIKASVVICVASSSVEDMERRAGMIRREYEDLNFIVERPLTDQLKLFMQYYPSVSFGVKDFIMKLTPLTLASGVIGATRMLGDDVGTYIGTTGPERKPVYFDMGLACRMNKSASATFFGSLGFGKSFNANLLVYLNFIYGGYALIFDPKGERTHWESFAPFKGLINIVSLSSEARYKGCLDPFNIYRDNPEAAKELALNVVCEIFKIPTKDSEYTALQLALTKIDEYEKPSMLKLSEILEGFTMENNEELTKAARNLGLRLSLLKGGGMATLIFGDGTEEAIRMDNRINILQIQNLTLPSPETKKDEYTQEETVSTVLMMIMANFAKKFALQELGVFKIVLFDESWALGKTTEGVKLYEFLARMGRSLYTSCIFNGHSVLDIPTEGIKNSIRYKFCFNTDNRAEAERMLEYIGLEVTEQNVELIRNLENGECLFQDLYRRVGVLRFDAVFRDIADLFSTTPTDKGIKATNISGAFGFTLTDRAENTLNAARYADYSEYEEADIYAYEEV